GRWGGICALKPPRLFVNLLGRTLRHAGTIRRQRQPLPLPVARSQEAKPPTIATPAPCGKAEQPDGEDHQDQDVCPLLASGQWTLADIMASGNLVCISWQGEDLAIPDAVHDRRGGGWVTTPQRH